MRSTIKKDHFFEIIYDSDEKMIVYQWFSENEKMNSDQYKERMEVVAESFANYEASKLLANLTDSQFPLTR